MKHGRRSFQRSGKPRISARNTLLFDGCNENTSKAPSTGSPHNIVLGVNNGYSSYGDLVAGVGNLISGTFASVSGGNGETASGSWASVSGGNQNVASATNAHAGGGQFNEASGAYASVGGGQTNAAGGEYASVGGGLSNSAAGSSSTVGGGNNRSPRARTLGGRQAHPRLLVRPGGAGSSASRT